MVSGDSCFILFDRFVVGIFVEREGVYFNCRNWDVIIRII